MKKIVIAALFSGLVFAAVAPASVSASILPTSGGNYLDRYRNSNSRDMCMSQSYDRKIDAVLIDEIPSILDQCGIGGLIDICGMLGKFSGVFGEALGCGGGSSGGSKSRFCNWGFNKQSAKEAWRVYRNVGSNTKANERNEWEGASEIYASNLDSYIEVKDEAVVALVRYKVLGLMPE